jgi:hypothetical protein
MTQQFQRSVEVQVDTIKFSDLDVEFAVVKTLKPEPNTCTLKIWNLNPMHRKQLDSAKLPAIEIKAGYKGAVSLVFRGEVREVFSAKEGGDWVTEMSTADSEDTIKRARINKSFPSGTHLPNVLQALANELKVDAKAAILKLLTSNKLVEAAGVFLNGTVVSGSASREMTNLLKSAGQEWSVQDGELQIIDIGAALLGLPVVLGATTGLVGSPTVGNDDLVRFKALLNTSIAPGSLVTFVSDLLPVGSFYRVERAEFNGQTRGSDWYVEGEASAI